MNCKPGDLAVIVRSYSSEYLGWIVTVKRPNDVPIYDKLGPGWIVDHNGSAYHTLDEDLRPIRDPGDDAVDETLLWLPAPKEKTACPYSPNKETA